MWFHTEEEFYNVNNRLDTATPANSEHVVLLCLG
jgi:hypothetical protein